MSDVTRILSQIDSGDPHAADQLLPLVYHELRKLATAKLAQERPGHTLQATALVHDAYLRLVGEHDSQKWDSRGHFFAAAAEAMRRILIDQARRKQSEKSGGGFRRQLLDDAQVAIDDDSEEILALDDALHRLAKVDPLAAQLVQLRFFAGLTTEQAAELLGMSSRTAYYTWTYARSWLHRALRED